jgi:hypothetical protein
MRVPKNALPLAAGATAQIRKVLAEAHKDHKRFAIIGDSQETNLTELPQHLNLQAFLRYGQPSELPFMPTEQDTDNFTYACLPTETAALASNTANELPRTPFVATNGTNYGPLYVLRHDGGAASPLGGRGDVFFNPSGSVVLDAILRRSTTGPAQVQVVETKSASPAAAYTGQVVASHRSTGLGLNSANTGFVTYTTPALSHDPALPYKSAMIQGWTGAAVATGLTVVGGRFRDTSKNRGISWTPFSQGGYSTTDYGSQHANAGPLMAHLGPWDCIFISASVNDLAYEARTPDVFKTNLSNLIALIRTWTGNPNQLIALVSDGPLAPSASRPWAEEHYPQYASCQLELAMELPNVVFLNVGRLMEEYNNPLEFYTDGTHIDFGLDSILAESWWRILDELPGVASDGGGGGGGASGGSGGGGSGSVDLASPGPIGNTTPSTIAGTTISASEVSVSNAVGFGGYKLTNPAGFGVQQKLDVSNSGVTNYLVAPIGDASPTKRTLRVAFYENFPPIFDAVDGANVTSALIFGNEKGVAFGGFSPPADAYAYFLNYAGKWGVQIRDAASGGLGLLRCMNSSNVEVFSVDSLGGVSGRFLKLPQITSTAAPNGSIYIEGGKLMFKNPSGTVEQISA